MDDTGNGANNGIGTHNGSEEASASAQPKARHKRGPSIMPRLLGNNKKVQLDWNNYNQPIGLGWNASRFPEAIGIFLKDYHRIDWTKEWPEVDPEIKESIWERVRDKFGLDETRKQKIKETCAANAFRSKKKHWKRTYYKRYKTNEERLANRPQDLTESQWKDLVYFWGTPEQQSKMRELAGMDEHGAPRPTTNEHDYKATPTIFYGSSSRGNSSMDMENRMQEEIDRQVEEKMTELESRWNAQQDERYMKMREEMRAMISQLHSNDKNVGSSGSDKENTSSPQATTYQNVDSRGSDKENVSSPQAATSQSHIASTMLHRGAVSKRCMLLNWQGNVVAEGIIASMDSNELVHHIPLGVDSWKVWVRVALDPKASLWRPTSEMLTIEDAVGSTIAWHKKYISFN